MKIFFIAKIEFHLIECQKLRPANVEAAIRRILVTPVLCGGVVVCQNTCGCVYVSVCQCHQCCACVLKCSCKSQAKAKAQNRNLSPLCFSAFLGACWCNCVSHCDHRTSGETPGAEKNSDTP